MSTSSGQRRVVRVGIDATNIRIGGGLTHLAEVIAHADPAAAGINRITVWGPSMSLARLPQRPWLEARSHPWQDGPLPQRIAWQRLHLTREATEAADVLLIPGGSYAGPFRPFVAMAQSLLPFDRDARNLYPAGSWMQLRNWMLYRQQGGTLRRADGVIFLTGYGRDMVESSIGPIRGRSAVIPLGITPGIVPVNLRDADDSSPFRWLYLSSLEAYKHHLEVVEAGAELARRGHRIAIEFIGPGSRPAERRLRAAIDASRGSGADIRYVGAIAPERVPSLYARFDGGLCASSCESWGIPLVDGLSAGLPTACSNRSTLPEVAGDAVVYFDPRDPASIAHAMETIMTDRSLRDHLATRGPKVTRAFDWRMVADSTLRFLVERARASFASDVDDAHV